MLYISKPDSSLGHVEPVFATMVYIGIDISKSSFVAAYPSTNGYRTRTFPNTTAGVRKFIATLSVTEHHCVMEATGNYGFLLLYLLHQMRYCRQSGKSQADQAFCPDDDDRYQDRRERRLHDRHVRGEDESSYLQNALAGYHSAQTEEDSHPSAA